PHHRTPPPSPTRRSSDLVEEDVVVGRSADCGAVALWAEVLARPTPARADDEGWSLRRDLIEGAVLDRDLLRGIGLRRLGAALVLDRKSTRLNSSHRTI